MRSVAVAADLAPFIAEFMFVEVTAETTRVRLPEPGLVLGVRYQGRASLLDGERLFRLPDAVLTGTTTRARRMRTAAGGGIVLARFRPGGAAPFFPQPLHELLGCSVGLSELVAPADADRLATEIAAGGSDAQRVAALEAFLRARLCPGRIDPLVAAALRALEEARGQLPIRALARRLGISQDPLEKRFRRAVGATPKQLASLLRFRHAVAGYRPGTPLTALAQDAGYFDQSHFNREVRAVTGESPGRFLRRGEYL